MSERDVQLVIEALSDAVGENGSVDMIRLARDPAPEKFASALDPDAEVRFFTPGGLTFGEMTGPFVGVEGIRSGWREWTEPYESFTATIRGLEDGADGRVLILVETRARHRGGGPEVRDDTAAVYMVRDGRIVAIDHYLDQDEARRAAGVPHDKEE